MVYSSEVGGKLGLGDMDGMPVKDYSTAESYLEVSVCDFY